jgi:hypothetical protein
MPPSCTKRPTVLLIVGRAERSVLENNHSKIDGFQTPYRRRLRGNT